MPLRPTAQAQGLFDIFGGGNSGGFGAPQPRSPAEGGGASEGGHRSRHAKKRSKVFKEDDDEGSGGGGSGYTSMCVRECDGYTFPVGLYRGAGDRPAQEAICRAQCPEAKTHLYIRPGGSDEVGDAVRADTNQSYTKLPAAFKFKSEHSEACTCHRIGTHGRVSFMRDFTLRRGDVVMTKDGLKVFHGGTFPFKVSAFSPLLQSRDVARKDLPVFEAMNRARLRAGAGASRELTVTRRPTADPKPAANP